MESLCPLPPAPINASPSHLHPSSDWTPLSWTPLLLSLWWALLHSCQYTSPRSHSTSCLSDKHRRRNSSLRCHCWPEHVVGGFAACTSPPVEHSWCRWHCNTIRGYRTGNNYTICQWGGKQQQKQSVQSVSSPLQLTAGMCWSSGLLYSGLNWTLAISSQMPI